jgi:chemotaxis-related protein WspB
MQLLTFSVAGHDYAIESRRVVEVLPRGAGRPIPHTPDYVLGVFSYRGSLVPLVDLGRRLAGTPPADRLSTRVIVVALPVATAAGSSREAARGDAPPDEGGAAPAARLGLVAENVIMVRSSDEAEATLPAFDLPDAAFLGPVLRLGDRLVQLVLVEHLLPTPLATFVGDAGRDSAAPESSAS